MPHLKSSCFEETLQLRKYRIQRCNYESMKLHQSSRLSLSLSLSLNSLYGNAESVTVRQTSLIIIKIYKCTNIFIYAHILHVCMFDWLMFTDDTVWLADSEEKFEKLVQEFGRVCRRRKLLVNKTKSKIMKIEKKGEENGVDISLNDRRMEEVETQVSLSRHIE